MRHRSTTYKLGAALAIGFLALLASSCGDDAPTDPVDETGKLLYVASSVANTISVIDTQTNAVTDTLTLDAPARILRLHPFRSSFYAVQPARDRVIKLLQRDSSVIAAIPTLGRTPWDLTFTATPDAAQAFVSLHDSNTVAVVRLAEDRVLQSIPVGRGPGDIELDLTSRGRIWVVNELGRSISVIDLSNNTVIKTLTVVTQPRHVLFSGSLAYVTDAATATVQPVRLDTLETDPNAPAVQVGRQPEGMALQPNSNNLLVANNGDNTLLIVDLVAPETRTIVPTGAGPTEILVNNAGTRAYVANTGESSITVVDLTAKQVLATIPVGAAPRGMALF